MHVNGVMLKYIHAPTCACVVKLFLLVRTYVRMYVSSMKACVCVCVCACLLIHGLFSVLLASSCAEPPSPGALKTETLKEALSTGFLLRDFLFKLP